MQLTAQLFNARENPINDNAQHIRSDVRLCLIQNILGSTELIQLAQDPRALGIADTRQQLSVRKGSGTTGAELNVTATSNTAAVLNSCSRIAAGMF